MKHKRYIIVFIFMIVIAFILSDRNMIIRETIHTEADYSAGYPLSNSAESDIKVQTVKMEFNKNGIKAEYPRIVSGGNEEELYQWNQIIEEDFNKILKQYSFEPDFGPSQPPSNQVPVFLTIKYSLKRVDRGYVSILYLAAFNNPYSAHPTELIYTTNIDTKSGKRLYLKDIVKLDKEFVKEFRTWNFNQPDEPNEEYNKAIADYVAGLSDDDLLMGFQAADIIGTENLFGIYSYLTNDRLGISIGAPNYIGDHIEFEKKYSEIKEFLMPGF